MWSGNLTLGGPLFGQLGRIRDLAMAQWAIGCAGKARLMLHDCGALGCRMGIVMPCESRVTHGQAAGDTHANATVVGLLHLHVRNTDRYDSRVQSTLSCLLALACAPEP